MPTAEAHRLYELIDIARQEIAQLMPWLDFGNARWATLPIDRAEPRQRNLVRPMISGDKHLPAGTPAAIDNAASRLFALVLLMMCVAVVRWLVGLGD